LTRTCKRSKESVFAYFDAGFAAWDDNGPFGIASPLTVAWSTDSDY